jgi:putative transcriptional regulator
MKRHLDELIERMIEDPPRPRRRRARPDDGQTGRPPAPPPARRPTGTLEGNPLIDPCAPMPGVEDAPDRCSRSRTPVVEFTPEDIIRIRHRLHATQRQFAKMFGISVGTLRQWEHGRRRPRGPARSLLRIARSNPGAVARTLWRYRRDWWMD